MENRNTYCAVPARVKAALTYLENCRFVFDFCEARETQTDIAMKEKCVQRAALEVLRTYFLCEMDFGDTPPRTPEPPGDDDAASSPMPIS